VRGAQGTAQQHLYWDTTSDRLDVITCAAVNGGGTPQMYHIGSYKYVFRPRQPPWEPSRSDTWSECTADVQSARLGPDGISREYRRGRSGISVSRLYLRNVARCTVKRPSKRPSSYMPKLSNGGCCAARIAHTWLCDIESLVWPTLRRDDSQFSAYC